MKSNLKKPSPTFCTASNMTDLQQRMWRDIDKEKSKVKRLQIEHLFILQDDDTYNYYAKLVVNFNDGTILYNKYIFNDETNKFEPI